MNKRSIFAAIVGLIMVSMLVAPAFAKGPSKAKMGQNGNGKWIELEDWGPFVFEGFYNTMADMYVGLDYGVGSTETYTTDGYYVGVIEGATLMDNGHYHENKIWISYKFWLTSPVEMTCPDGSEYTATQFIFFVVQYDLSDSSKTTTIQAYK